MTRGLALAALIGVLVVTGVAPPADAQRGEGRGRGRARPPAVREETVGPGEYALDGATAIAAVNRGEGAQALAYYERAAGQAERDGNPVRAARALHAAAAVTQRLGQLQRTIQLASRAIEMFRRVDAGELTQNDIEAWASVYSGLGRTYQTVGNLPKATQMLEEGLQLARAGLQGRRAAEAEGFLLTGLAAVAYAQHDFRTALERNTQAAQFFEAAEAGLGPRAPARQRTKIRRWLAESYRGIGTAQVALLNFPEADAAFDRGLKAARLSGLREVEISLLAAAGGAALARHDWTRALGLYQQSIALAEPVKRSAGRASLYGGLAHALSGLGRTEEGLAAAREAVRYIEELRADIGDAALRSSFLESRQRVYQFAISLALQAQHGDEAFALAERARARTFLDLLGSQTTLSKGRTRALVDEEVRLRARLAAAKAEAQDADGAGDSPETNARVEAVERDYQAFLDRVRKENVEQASLMTVEPVTLSEIQALLPDGTALLEYLLMEDGAVAWILDRQHFAVVRIPGDRQSLVAQVRRFRAAISGLAPIQDVEAQAQALYRRLLAPVRHEIRGDRLVIVPHGVLHYLPFAALRAPAGRWMVQDLTITTLPSASVLRYLRDKGASAPPRALVVGNPDLGAELNLPWAEREARLVGQRVGAASVLLRGEATEARTKALIEGAGLVHLATHGELQEADPLSSAVLLAPGGGEDGRLEVREVFALDLRASLVVLSACETGLGRLSRGDEILGLQRAFLYAGAPAVVTTLWKVGDRASYELIRAFYDRLATAGPADALRQAQIETLASFPHPFSWAGYELAGAPAPAATPSAPR